MAASRIAIINDRINYRGMVDANAEVKNAPRGYLGMMKTVMRSPKLSMKRDVPFFFYNSTNTNWITFHRHELAFIAKNW